MNRLLVNSRVRSVFAALFASLLAGCISIQRPADNDVVIAPSATTIAVRGNAPYTDLKASVDGNDVTSQLSPSGSNSHTGSVPIALGPHRVDASASLRALPKFGLETRLSSLAHGM